MAGDAGCIVLEGNAEQYLRNCSFACYYYRNEKDIKGEFDHFDLFHKIHFADLKAINIEDDIVKILCGLFRIDFQICDPFVLCKKLTNEVIELNSKTTFNDLFRTISFSYSNGVSQMTLETDNIKMGDSLDALFAIKDLLFARQIDTSSIPEYSVFAIGQDEQIEFRFETPNRQFINIIFKYDKLKLDIKKNCTYP
jgi:hypothetical protein